MNRVGRFLVNRIVGRRHEKPAQWSADQAIIRARLVRLSVVASLLIVATCFVSPSPVRAVAKTSNVTSGNWNTAATWSPSGVPAAADTVTIRNGDTITIDTSPTIASLQVGQGTSGSLIFEDNTARTLTVSGTVTVSAGATLRGNDTNNSLTHVLSIAGDFTNNGTFRQGTQGVVNVTTNGTAVQTIGGTPTTFAFNNLTISNTSAAVSATANFSIATGATMTVNASATFNAGTSIVSGAGTFTLATGSTLGIGSTVGITAAPATLTGNIQTTTARNFVVGANYTYNGAASQSMGTGFPTNLTGILTINNPANTVTLDNARTIANGGTVSIVAGTFAAGTNLTMATTSSITRSGGTMTGTPQGAGVYNVTYTGNSMTSTTELNGSGLNNVTVNLTAGQTLTLGAAVVANGTITLTAGTLNVSASNFAISVGVNWTNNGGTFTPQAGTVTFNGTGAQTINGTATSQTFNNVTIAKTAATLLNTGGSTTTLTVKDLTETTGNFTAPATLNITGNFSHAAGTYTAGTNTNFNGTTQSLGGATATTFTTLTIANGSTTTGTTAPTATTFNINGGGKYIQPNGTAVPGTTRTFAATSTYEYQTTGSTTWPGVVVTWGNLIINVAGSASNLSAAGNLTTVAGNLQIKDAGSGSYRLAANTSPTVDISGNLVVDAGLFNFSTGTGNPTVNVTGSVQLNGGTLQPATSMGVPIFTVKGDWTNSGGTFTPGTGTVTFNSTTAAQAINGTATTQTFNSLTVAKSTQLLSVGGSTTTLNVSSTLTFTSGNLDAATNSATVAIGSAGTVSRTSGHVIGNLKQTYTATGTKTFDVGTANGYSPVSVNVTAGTFNADFTVSATQGPQPRVPDTTKALQRYWTLTGTGVTATLTFNYLDPTDIPGTATEANFQIVKVSGTTPSFPGGSVNTGANTATISGVTSFSDWTLSEPFAPTAVELAAFNAVSGPKGGAFLQWQTGYEVANLGFNIYRDQGGKRSKVNPSLIAGSALMIGPKTALTAGLSYAWMDAAATDPNSTQYWLEDVDLNGKSTWHGPISPMLGGQLPPQADALLLRNLKANSTSSQQVIISAARPATVAHGSQSAATNSQGFATKPPNIVIDPLQTQWNIVAQACVKIAIRKDGWYRITQPELVAAGLNPARDPFFLKLYTDALEVPILVNGGSNGRLEPGDSIEFYGLGLDTPDTDVRTYYLVSSNAAGRRIPSVSSVKGQPGEASYPATIERKDRSIYFIGLKNGDADNWFGPILTATPVTQTLTVLHKDASATGDATLEIALQGVTDAEGATPDHSIQVSLNGQVIGTINFDGQAHQVSSLSVSNALLQEGDNTLSLVAQNGSMDVSLLDYVRLTYAHTFAADSDRLPFTAAGGAAVEVSGFSSAAVRVADVTDTGNVQMMNSTVSAQGGGYTLSVVTAGSGARTLYAFADSQALHPAAITANQPSTLNLAKQGADIVMIAHRDFIPSLTALRAHRNGQGYAVTVVDVEDVYDEFSYGARSPQALKDFLLRAKTVWKRTPRFVLLMGDASYDPHNYLGLGDHDFVPSKQIETAQMETASDDWCVDFNNDGLPELAIGRLPARTAAEATTLVTKIVDYEQRGQVEGAVLVADRNDGFDFENASQQVKALLPGNMDVQQVYRSQMDDATAHDQIVNLINRGPKLVNYVGHGSFGLWRGNLLTVADAANMTNQQGLTFVISMTCLNGQFQDPYSDGLAESLLKAADGGAVGIWASSALTEPNGQALMNQEAIWQIFNGVDAKGRPLTLGEAVMRAKAATADSDVRRSWVLLGDPTTRLR